MSIVFGIISLATAALMMLSLRGFERQGPFSLAEMQARLPNFPLLIVDPASEAAHLQPIFYLTDDKSSLTVDTYFLAESAEQSAQPHLQMRSSFNGVTHLGATVPVKWAQNGVGYRCGSDAEHCVWWLDNRGTYFSFSSNWSLQEALDFINALRFVIPATLSAPRN